jgi:hypothetical protein
VDDARRPAAYGRLRQDVMKEGRVLVSTIAGRAPAGHARPAPPHRQGRGARTGLAIAALLALALVPAVALPSRAASTSGAKTLRLAAVTIQSTTWTSAPQA